METSNCNFIEAFCTNSLPLYGVMVGGSTQVKIDFNSAIPFAKSIFHLHMLLFQ